MIYIGEFNGYQVYQNDQGNLEGYKSIGVKAITKNSKIAKDSNRVVSNTSDLKEFIEKWLTKKPRKKEKPYNPETNPDQTKLFSE